MMQHIACKAVLTLMANILLHPALKCKEVIFYRVGAACRGSHHVKRPSRLRPLHHRRKVCEICKWRKSFNVSDRVSGFWHKSMSSQQCLLGMLKRRSTKKHYSNLEKTDIQCVWLLLLLLSIVWVILFNFANLYLPRVLS